ncbi:MAG TPA: amidohydrolase family protein [Terracidiphilus sp.]|nr:amidohydrolase family protein [Terracidiphilus sp.]
MRWRAPFFSQTPALRTGTARIAYCSPWGESMRRWGIRLLSAVVVLLALFFAFVWLTEFFPRRVAHPPLQLAEGTLAIEHALIYVSPTDPPIADGAILIRNGLIAAVGRQIEIPAGTTEVPCNGCVVTAGFWNAHVHFTEPKWAGAEFKSAAALTAQLADMFLSRGFTTVVDLGSNPADTLSIRRRVESAELSGPFIYTAGPPLYPPHGIPYYLHDTTPAWIRALMLQPPTPAAARNDVQRNLAAGSDLIKLFTGSWVARGRVLPMPLPIAKAAVETAHLNGKLVFAHPSNLAGTRVAVDSGVDVLAHAADDTEGISEGLLATAVHNNMAMVPTLKMFSTTVTTNPKYMDPIYNEVHQFHSLGGTLIFGTDVGYMTDYSTQGEFDCLGKAGLNATDVLAMLTTHPAAKLGVSAQKGTVTEGKLADLTILDADPAAGLDNFSRVRAVIRSGRLIWQR